MNSIVVESCRADNRPSNYETMVPLSFFLPSLSFIYSSRSYLLSFPLVTLRGICAYWLWGHMSWKRFCSSVCPHSFFYSGSLFNDFSILGGTIIPSRGSHLVYRRRIDSVFKYSDIEVHVINYKIAKPGNWNLERYAIFENGILFHLQKIRNYEINSKIDKSRLRDKHCMFPFIFAS